MSSWFALPIPTRCPLAMPFGQTSATAAIRANYGRRSGVLQAIPQGLCRSVQCLDPVTVETSWIDQHREHHYLRT